MTLKEAKRVVNIWGKYLDYCFGRFNMLFQGKIPESLLPLPKPILEDALNILDRYYFEQGDKHAMTLMRETMILLELYTDDEKAIEHAGTEFTDQKRREKIASSIRDWQFDWLKTQGFFE